ncbi:hypothetical protein T4A_8418 [Trichinella pseudospiralis]|uniref:Uncharacterized protein n=1 Tax=Trichinella pseudospiralis TaxID=6337 RepID=A0A0V1EA13_TRIPS|nr:hypothetical protein T4A_8418 [Trichinella pseudospiralis]
MKNADDRMIPYTSHSVILWYGFCLLSLKLFEQSIRVSSTIVISDLYKSRSVNSKLIIVMKVVTIRNNMFVNQQQQQQQQSRYFVS